MIYLAKKYTKKYYKKVKHKFIRSKKKAITNNDLYRLVLLQQKDQSDERYSYMVTLFLVFIVLCVLYTYHSG